jgi:hypothetical protein
MGPKPVAPPPLQDEEDGMTIKTMRSVLKSKAVRVATLVGTVLAFVVAIGANHKP